jgi:hypothetical protein
MYSVGLDGARGKWKSKLPTKKVDETASSTNLQKFR